MKCLKCGTELPENAKFCLNCGERAEQPSTETDDKVNTEKSEKIDVLENTETIEQTAVSEKDFEEDDVSEEVDNQPKTDTTEIYSETSKTINSKKVSFVNKQVSKIFCCWNNMDWFCKIGTVAAIFSVLSLIVAVCIGKAVPIIFAVLSVVGLVAAFLLHKGKIKSSGNVPKYLVFVVAVIFFVLSITTYSVKIPDIATTVYAPFNATDCIGKDQKEIKNQFYLSGFTNISEDPICDLEITQADKNGLIEKISINGTTDFIGNAKFKSSANVVITYHTFKNTNIPLSSEEVKSLDVETIKKAFIDAGFVNITTEEVYDLDPDETDVEFENRVLIDENEYFGKGSEFSIGADIKIVTHKPYEKYTLKLTIDFVPNLIFSTYDVELEIGEYSETLEHGEDAEFEYRLTPGSYKLIFRSEESSLVDGSVDLEITGDTAVSYKIRCYSDEINIETLYIENKSEVGENEAMIPCSSVDCYVENYKDIEKLFRDAGFTNITTKILYDIIWGITEEGEVDQVSVDGKTSFTRGNIFAKDVPVVITYHMNSVDDPNKPTETTTQKTTDNEKKSTELEKMSVYYSTNDYETAKKGNTGVFAYKNNGGAYDIYWIIDFDEGYVYWFTDGNGETTYDKVKIESGHLNDRITVTWIDGNDKWSWYLHFKYVNNPSVLVVNDGFATEFSPTNLNDALKIRSEKTISNN